MVISLFNETSTKTNGILFIFALSRAKISPSTSYMVAIFDGPVEARVACVDPLYTVLAEDRGMDAVAKGILKFMGTFSFLTPTYLLADILPS